MQDKFVRLFISCMGGRVSWRKRTGPSGHQCLSSKVGNPRLLRSHSSELPGSRRCRHCSCTRKGSHGRTGNTYGKQVRDRSYNPSNQRHWGKSWNVVQMKLMIRKSFQSCKAILTFGSWSGEQQRTDWDRCIDWFLCFENVQIVRAIQFLCSEIVRTIQSLCSENGSMSLFLCSEIVSVIRTLVRGLSRALFL